MATRSPQDANIYEFLLEENPAMAGSLRWGNEVCRTCEGEGTTWNGIVLTESDFMEDPEGQYEAIRNGYYLQQ